MKFVVRKSKWLRNRTAEVTRSDYSYGGGLLNTRNGMKCCLGHCAVQLGVKPKLLMDTGVPSDIEIDYVLKGFTKKEPGPNWYSDTPLSNEAVNINDDEETTDQQKMALLKALFKAHGHSIAFV